MLITIQGNLYFPTSIYGGYKNGFLLSELRSAIAEVDRQVPFLRGMEYLCGGGDSERDEADGLEKETKEAE